MIDEEGGSVKRLTNIIDFQISQKFFGDMYKYNTNISILTLKKYNHNISSTLKSLGINMNTVPVLDVLEKNTHKIIGDRSFSKDPKIVKILGKECVKNYTSNKIATVIKHIPGHGSCKADSHLTTPIVDYSKI